MMPSTTQFAVGIDLGGTKTEIVVLDAAGAALLRKRLPTPRKEGYEAVVSCVAGLVTEAVAGLPDEAAYTVGIGIPGSIGSDTDLVRNANSTCLIGHPLRHDLEAVLNCPVRVRNDADCFTMAECHAGAGRGYGLVFGIIMGTGCGGGVCIDGIVREGPHRIAGEWGHICMDRDGAQCYCDKRGCVETLISGSGVEHAYWLESGLRMDMHAIVELARAGDAIAGRIFDRFIDDFGRCVGGVISLMDPDAVILGGGLSNIEELYGAGIERIRHYAFHDNLKTPILKNMLGDSAGVFGAAWIGREAMTDQSTRPSG